MLDYIKRHWFVVLLILGIWGFTFWTIENRKPTIIYDTRVDSSKSVDDTTIIIDNDSIVHEIKTDLKVMTSKYQDSLRILRKVRKNLIKISKDKSNQELKTIEFQEKLLAIESKRYEEPVRQKMVFQSEPQIDNLKREIAHLKEEIDTLKKELDTEKKIRISLENEKIRISEQYTKSDTIRKRKKLFGLF